MLDAADRSNFSQISRLEPAPLFLSWSSADEPKFVAADVPSRTYGVGDRADDDGADGHVVVDSIALTVFVARPGRGSRSNTAVPANASASSAASDGHGLRLVPVGGGERQRRRRRGEVRVAATAVRPCTTTSDVGWRASFTVNVRLAAPPATLNCVATTTIACGGCGGAAGAIDELRPIRAGGLVAAEDRCTASSLVSVRRTSVTTLRPRRLLGA